VREKLPCNPLETCKFPLDRLVLKAQPGNTRYAMPQAVGEILSVKYVDGAYPDGVPMLELPTMRSYLHMNGLALIPQDEKAAKLLMKSAFNDFHKPLWTRMEIDGVDTLLIYPIPCNTSYFVLEVEPCRNQQT